MAGVDRYPTWVLLVVAVAAAVAVVLRYMRLDRGANPRRAWLGLLAGLLVVIGVADLGLLVSRTGQPITPNEGLLVVADVFAGLLVTSILVGRAARRLTDAELHQIRGRGALIALLGRRGSVAAIAVVIGTIGVLLAAESALADRLPRPPAAVACEDFTTWITAPANAGLPPVADQGILNHAVVVAPPGRLQVSLDALALDVQAAIDGGGTVQRLVEEERIVSDETAVTHACKSVQAVS
jgi:4-amino-4-deoxy-L-arabinose transferase-like glycosyltransferase